MLASASSASANTLYFQMNPNELSGPRQVFVFGPANASGAVTGPNGFNQSFDLGAEGFAVVNLNLSDQLTSGAVENKGFKVTSDASVSGYFLSRAPATTDMTYLIDGDTVTGTESGAFNLSGTDGSSGSEIDVAVLGTWTLTGSNTIGDYYRLTGSGRNATMSGTLTTGTYFRGTDIKYSGTWTVGANSVLTRCGQ
jgi:hypothetical protein